MIRTLSTRTLAHLVPSYRFGSVTLLSLLVSATVPVLAQSPPDTDIYWVAVDGSGDEKPTFGEPRNLTQRPGYDNQPHFLPDGRGLLYSSFRDGQTDIYLYDLEKDRTAAVTSTPENEFSPTAIEGGRAFTVVRVEATERQRVWRFPLTPDKAGQPELLIPDAEPVGYYAWGEDGARLLFILGDPHNLEFRAPQAKPKVIAQNIGRSVQRIPGTSKFGFVIKNDKDWRVATYDSETSILELHIATLPEREDLTWDAQGRAWLADGSRLYRYCPDCSGGWRRMVDFGADGITEITRLAFSADGSQLAFVVVTPATTE